ncbi:MAG: hypothetical protein PHN60_03590 [Candidatus Gracilibacteria bacterium]|nr:hypothetical protein [Candidatus Gracilibacteria bacterium]
MIKKKQRRKYKCRDNHKKRCYCEKYIPKRRCSENGSHIIYPRKKYIKKEKRIDIFLFFFEKGIKNQNTQERDNRKYAIYNKKYTRGNIFTEKKEKEKTINKSEYNAVRSKNKKNGFLFFLEKKEKDARNKQRESKGYIVKYFSKMREIIKKIYTINKPVKRSIKKEESYIIRSFFEIFYYIFYRKFFYFFTVSIYFLMIIFFFFYKKREYLTKENNK